MIEPLNDFVAVLVSEEAETRNGIVIPDAMRKKANEGVVVATGPGRMTEMGLRPKPSVGVGDRVLFQGGHFKANVDGEELLMLREHEIVAVLERAEQPRMRAGLRVDTESPLNPTFMQQIQRGDFKSVDVTDIDTNFTPAND